MLQYFLSTMYLQLLLTVCCIFQSHQHPSAALHVCSDVKRSHDKGLSRSQPQLFTFTFTFTSTTVHVQGLLCCSRTYIAS